jgi:hypothetical protein
MLTMGRAWARVIGGVGLAGLLFLGCGGGSDGDGSCRQGDTRQCTGPGSCTGGQVCDAEGEWSACDCGGGSSGASTGGSGGGGMSTGGSGPTAGTGGAPSSGGSTGGQGASAGWEDDPCEMEYLRASCDPSCVPEDQREDLCEEDMACSTFTNHTFQDFGTTLARRRYVFRTPSGSDETFRCDCDVQELHGIRVRVGRGPSSSSWRARITVGEPWRIYDAGAFYGVCDSSHGGNIDRFAINGEACAIYSSGSPTDFWILTNVPDAPARNVVFESMELQEAEGELSCP